LRDSQLGGDNEVYTLNQGTNQWAYANAYNISSLVSSGTGRVFALSFGDGHKVWELNGPSMGWSDSGASNIGSLVSDAAGDVFVLSDYFLGGNGWVYRLNGSTWSFVSPSYGRFTDLVGDLQGDVFVVGMDNNIAYKFIQGAEGDYPPWNVVDTGVADLQVGIGTVLDLKTNGVLQFSTTGNWGTWQATMSNVYGFSVWPNGTVEALQEVIGMNGQQTGWAMWTSPDGEPGTWTLMWSE
jgi:hypothetical protein